MKKQILSILSLFLLAGLSSCLTSLNPLITEQNISLFDAAIGTWQNNKGYTVKIEPYNGSNLQHKLDSSFKKDSKAKPATAKEDLLTKRMYVLSFSRNAVNFDMDLAFAKINGQWFAQCYPIVAEEASRKQSDKGDPLWGPLSDEHTYSFARVEVVNGTLQFTPPDPAYLRSLMDKGAMGIPFERDVLFDTQLVTASTEQLQSFFAKYGSDPQLFNKNTTLVFKQPSL